jgi:hypothetical protein
VKVPRKTDHRRAYPRFEIVGNMPAALASTQTFQVLNLGVSGALVESSCALPEYAELKVQLILDRHVSEALVKVRRVVHVRGRSGEPAKYQMGFEFLSLTPEAEDEINRLIVNRLASDLGAEV